MISRSARRDRSGHISRLLLTLTVLLALSVLALFIFAALGSKWGWWDWKFGMGVLTRTWGPRLAWLAIGVAAVSTLWWLVARPRWGAVVCLFALILPAGLLYGLRNQQKLVLALPAIYDVQTDWTDPVGFSTDALAAREAAGATNPVQVDPVIVDDGRRGKWANMRFADAQRAGYPQITPLIVDLSPEAARIAALEAAAEEGLIVDRVFQSGGETFIEGHAVTAWYGLVDDFVIRLRENGSAQTRVDMRSIGREGHIDLGMNAKRISGVFDGIETRATQP